MVWRAGSASGVNAADGGRDIEATFPEPQEDGTLVKKRWWFEAKGRSSTISRTLVMESAMTAFAYGEVDVVAFCTNSIFSNPTLDWAREWNRTHEKPKLYTWDRANLAGLVRQYPLVAARVLPEALDDEQRLSLLLQRFSELGEMPSSADRDYFWERPETVGGHTDVVELLVMFVYSEDDLGRHPWTKLMPADADAARSALLEAALIVPWRIFTGLPRPLDSHRAIRSSAHVMVSVLNSLPAEEIAEILERPPIEVGSGEEADLQKLIAVWHQELLPYILGDVQLQLRDICANDCARVMADPAAFPPAVDAEEFFRRLGLRPPKDAMQLILQSRDQPCAIGFPLKRDQECPVVQDIVPAGGFFRDLQRVIDFRLEHPSGQLLLTVKDMEPDFD
jgi:hypothetical protein